MPGVVVGAPQAAYCHMLAKASMHTITSTRAAELLRKQAVAALSTCGKTYSRARPMRAWAGRSVPQV